MDSNLRVDQRLAMSLDKPRNITEFRLAQSVVRGRRHWLQPEFGFAILAFNVNVRRLASFAAVEVKPIRPNAQDSWHACILSREQLQSTHS
jgi:hypothetical protein